MTHAPATSMTATTEARTVRPAARRHTRLGQIVTVFGGNFGALLLGFVANLWAMRALGPEQYGVLAVVLVVLNVAWQFSGKGLDSAAVCLGMAPEARGPAATFANVFGLKLAINAALLVLGVAAAGPLTRVFIGPEASAWPMVLAVVGAAGASLWGLMSAAIQADTRFGRYALVQTANNGLKLLAMGLLALAGALSVNSIMLATAGAFFGAACIGAWLAPRYAVRPGWHADALPGIVRFARWTVISSVLYLIYVRVDVLMLSRMSGGAPVGIYAAALAIIQILDLLTASTLTVFLPSFAKDTAREALRGQVRAALSSSLLLALPLALGYFLIDPGATLLVQLVGPGYTGIGPLLKIMYFGVLFTMITHPLHILFYAIGRPHVLTVVDVAMLVIVVVANYFAIRQAGPIGAAFVVLGARVLLGLVLVGSVWLVLKRRAVAVE